MPDSLALEYDRMYTEAPARWDMDELDSVRHHVIKQLAIAQDRRLLDIGCGSGHTLKYMHDRWPDMDYFGIDLSLEAVKLAQVNAPFAEITCTRLENCDLDGMDIILLGGVAEHFIDVIGSLRRVREMVRADGIVYLEVPNCIEYPGAHGEGFYRIRADAQMEWHYSRPRWETIIKEAGLVILQSIAGPNKYNEFIWILSK